jgi:hypothetical protein
VTEFQRQILIILPRFANGMGSTWSIAQTAFPEKWQNKSSRGALISQILRAGHALSKNGEISCVLPADGKFGEAILCSKR